MPKYALGTYP